MPTKDPIKHAQQKADWYQKNKQLTKEKGPNGRAIDHDHQTGNVRGVLCMACNMVEGQMKNIPLTPTEYGSKLETYLTR